MRPAERAGARLAVVQALYGMEVGGGGVVDALAEFESHWIGREVEGVQHPPAEPAFFRELLRGVVDEQRAVDGRVDAALSDGWPLKRVEAVLRAILRAGAYELMFRRDVPARVAISQYVEVAHSFYGDDEPALVNAVLDAVGREARPQELPARTGAPKLVSGAKNGAGSKDGSGPKNGPAPKGGPAPKSGPVPRGGAD